MENLIKKIYLAGGCFWGTEKYFSLIPGVISTEVGYANGKTQHPTYEEVCRENTGHAETVQVEYDSGQLSLTFLLELFFDVIDPTSLNRQGGDVGEQYRTGIYYVDDEDEAIIRGIVVLLGESLDKPVMIEVKPLLNYYPAEEYHQKYLDKNSGGYCHIDPGKFEKVRTAVDKKTKYRQQSKEELRNKLTRLQFEVTQNAATEPPFQNEYADTFQPGIYVDITSGEPLFVSTDKFESGCGWPSFSKPITPDLIAEFQDNSYGRSRIEVRSGRSDAHLGHVFEDGPKELGGLRYCINSAALRFIAEEDMEAEGYGHLLRLLGSK